MSTIIYIGDFSEFYATETYISHALESLGCKVLRVQESIIKTPQQILGAAQQYKADFVLFSKGKNEIAARSVALLKQHGVLTVGWLFDLFFDTPSDFGRRQITNASFRCDICFMTDGGHDEQWRFHGVKRVLLRQGIHEPDAHYGNGAAGPDIIFLGTCTCNERKHLLDFLKITYKNDFRHYGQGGEHRPARGKALNDLLASVKIVVGDSIPSPSYWSNRIYEVLGRGGFLIHPRGCGIESEFTEGVHFVAFDRGNFKELRDKIDYYLAHPVEREAIRKAGHEHVKKNYTYTQRCKQLLKHVQNVRSGKN